jgi:hypothetical protein
MWSVLPSVRRHIAGHNIPYTLALFCMMPNRGV